jgi:hypothetical protein
MEKLNPVQSRSRRRTLPVQGAVLLSLRFPELTIEIALIHVFGRVVVLIAALMLPEVFD